MTALREYIKGTLCKAAYFKAWVRGDANPRLEAQSLFYRFLKSLHNFSQIFRQTVHAFFFQILRDTIEPLGYAPCDGGKSVAVAAQRDGGADHILEVCPFGKSGNGFGDSLLTTLHMMVGGADLITGAAQIILKRVLNVPFDFPFTVACPSKIIAAAVA